MPTPSLSLSEGFSTIKSSGSMEAGEEDSALGVRGQEADRALHCLELPVSTLHQNDMDSACCFPLAEQDGTGDVILFRFLLLVLLPRTAYTATIQQKFRD